MLKSGMTLQQLAALVYNDKLLEERLADPTKKEREEIIEYTGMLLNRLKFDVNRTTLTSKSNQIWKDKEYDKHLDLIEHEREHNNREEYYDLHKEDLMDHEMNKPYIVKQPYTG